LLCSRQCYWSIACARSTTLYRDRTVVFEGDFNVVRWIRWRFKVNHRARRDQVADGQRLAGATQVAWAAHPGDKPNIIRRAAAGGCCKKQDRSSQKADPSEPAHRRADHPRPRREAFRESIFMIHYMQWHGLTYSKPIVN